MPMALRPSRSSAVTSCVAYTTRLVKSEYGGSSTASVTGEPFTDAT
jgi:hypothetical protein